MHSISNEQREALMALKDGPLPSGTFNAAHNSTGISDLFPDFIEVGQRKVADGVEGIVTLTQKGHTALVTLGRKDAAAKAAGMAGQMIDFLADQSSSREERKRRKDSLLGTQFKFENIRLDVSGSEG